MGPNSTEIIAPEPNPFAIDFECVPNEDKGGFFITENICYGSVIETNWSIQIATDIALVDWECKQCKQSFQVTGMDKLKHIIGRTQIHYYYIKKVPSL